MTKEKKDDWDGVDRSVIDQFVNLDDVNDASKDDAVQEEITELKDRLLRALAEAENARKRAASARQEGEVAGKAEIISALTFALDNLERAVEAARQSAGDSDGILRQYADGIGHVRQEFRDALIKTGVDVIEPVGERFDPACHEAVATDHDAERPAGEIVAVVQQGYALGDRLIRPARVIVSARDNVDDNGGVV